jgi:hypothetical protein
MNKIYLPTVGPQDWQKLLADPEKQWRTGYSARTIAYAWEAAKGHFPPEVERIFPEAGDERVGNLEILLEFPEWKVYLPPAGHTSQNDLFVLANGEQGLVTTLESWLNSPTPGKLKRLAFILDLTRFSEARERESIGNSSPTK